MSENEEEVLRTFDEDLDGLTKIQKTFIVPDTKFIYFRKGEAANNVAIMGMIVTVLAIVYKAIKDYPDLRKGVKAILTDIKSAAKIVLSYIKEPIGKPCIREIACPDDPDVTVTLEILRRLGGDVRYLPKERRGRFRFFVNDKKYCLFVRKSNSRFSGIIGNDCNVIDALTEAFESEWEELSPLQPQLLPAVPGIAEAQKWNQDE